MKYEEAIKEIFPLIKTIWNKVDSGFYPEIGEEIKLVAIQRKISAGHYKTAFWSLIHFLFKDLLAMSSEDFSQEIEKIFQILESLEDQETVIIQMTKLVRKEVFTENKSLVDISKRALKLLQEKTLENIQNS